MIDRFCRIDDDLYQGGLQSSPLPSFITAVVDLDCSLEASPDVAFVVRAPIMDGPYPGMPWLRAVVGIVMALQRSQHVVFVHCAAGVSRSAMVAVACLMRKRGLNYRTALDWVGNANPDINPAPAFVRLLREYEETSFR